MNVTDSRTQNSRVPPAPPTPRLPADLYLRYDRQHYHCRYHSTVPCSRHTGPSLSTPYLPRLPSHLALHFKRIRNSLRSYVPDSLPTTPLYTRCRRHSSRYTPHDSWAEHYLPITVSPLVPTLPRNFVVLTAAALLCRDRYPTATSSILTCCHSCCARANSACHYACSADTSDLPTDHHLRLPTLFVWTLPLPVGENLPAAAREHRCAQVRRLPACSCDTV